MKLNPQAHGSVSHSPTHCSSQQSCESERSPFLKMERRTESSDGLDIELISLESRSASESDRDLGIEFVSDETRLTFLYETALFHFDDKNPRADPQIGISLLKRTAVQGSDLACLQIAHYYQAQDTSMTRLYAMLWYQQAMKLDSSLEPQCSKRCEEIRQAFFDLTHENLLDEFETLHNLARQKQLFAQYLLGLSYEKGYYKEIKVDSEKAFYWFKKVADRLKDPDIYFYLGLRYAKGDGCKKSFRKAIACFKKAELFKHYAARTELGILYYQKGKFTRAIGYLSTERQIGDPRVDFMLGEIYYYGLRHQDKQNAIFHYELAANLGCAEAQAALGLTYADSLNYKQAAFWFKKAAKQSHFVAKYKLALLDYYGMGVKQNREKAFVALYDIAMTLKSFPKKDSLTFDSEMVANLEYILGRMYVKGQGTEKDEEKGIEWLAKASLHGHRKAKSYMRSKTIG